MPDKKPEPAKPDKPDKRKLLKDLSEKVGKAVLIELVSQRKYQDALIPTQGARTPTQEDKACVRAAKQVWLSRSRERIMLLTQMEDLLGLVHTPKKSPGERLDQLPDDPT